ncbi:MAG: oligosaccharide flippase family protein [Bacteroidetes bacterium]|nr:oligosaccharide flippase family protein [Bacteroidota bacterium]
MLKDHLVRYSLARGIPSLLNFVGLLFYTRLLLPSQFGQYAIVLANAEIAYTVVFQWLQLSALRFIPGEPETTQKAVQDTVVNLYFWFSFLGFILIGVYAIIPGVEVSPLLLWGGFGIMLSMGGVRLLLDIYRARLQPGLFGRLSLVRSVLVLGLSLIFIKVGLGGEALVLGQAMGAATAAFFVGRFIWTSSFQPKINWRHTRIFASYGLPLAASFAVDAILHNFDRLMIAGIMGQAEAGLYSAGYNVVQQVLLTVLIIINLAGYPLAVKYYQEGDQELFRDHLKQFFSIILAISTVAMLNLVFGADLVSQWTLGIAFRTGAREIIPLLAIAIFFMGIRAFYFNLAFQLSQKVIWQFVILAVTAVINIGLNWLWIPIYGIKGAATATLVSFAIALLVNGALGSRYVRLAFPAKELAIILLGIGVFGLSAVTQNYLGFENSYLVLAVGNFMFLLTLVITNYMGIQRFGRMAVVWIQNWLKKG